MPQELLTFRSEHCPGLVTHEQGPSKPLLEQANAGAYRGLANMQTLGGADEIAAADDFQERSDSLCIHDAG